MVSDLVDDDSTVRVKPEAGAGRTERTGRRKRDDRHLLSAGNRSGDRAGASGRNWEEIPDTTERSGRKTLYRKDRMIVTARVVHAADAVEINTYEQLREIDSDSSQLQTDAIQVICEALGAQQDEVTNITVLKRE